MGHSDLDSIGSPSVQLEGKDSMSGLLFQKPIKLLHVFYIKDLEFDVLGGNIRPTSRRTHCTNNYYTTSIA